MRSFAKIKSSRKFANLQLLLMYLCNNTHHVLKFSTYFFFLYKNKVNKIEKMFNMIYFVLIILSMKVLLYFDAVQRDMPFRRTLNTVLNKALCRYF